MGKRTTTRHKNDNTFKYKGQKELQRQIVINRLGSIGDWILDEEEDDGLSFLYKAMIHWKDLNLYNEFTDVLDEIGGDIKLLPQVIHQKDKIKDILLSKIEVASSGFLQPLYGLLTAFVSDLQQEFVEYLPPTLQRITELVLCTTDTKIISLSLDCYSRLLKDCKSAVLNKFSVYFKVFLPFLGSRVKDYVMRNGVKTISFVCAKFAKNNEMLLYKKMHRALQTSKENLENGFIHLLYELLTSSLIPKESISLKKMINFIDDCEDNENWENLICKLLKMLVTLRSKQSPKNLAVTVWTTLEESLVPLFFSKHFRYSSRLLHTICENQDFDYCDPESVQDVLTNIVQVLLEIKDVWHQAPEYQPYVITCLRSLLRFKGAVTVTKSLLQLVLTTTMDNDVLKSLDLYYQLNCIDYKNVMALFGNAYRELSTRNPTQSSAWLSWNASATLSRDGGVQIPSTLQNETIRFHGLSLPCYFFGANLRDGSSVGYEKELSEALKPERLTLLASTIENPELLLENFEEFLQLLIALQQVDLRQNHQIRDLLVHLFDNLLAFPCEVDLKYSTVQYLILEAIGRSNCLDELKGKNIENFVDRFLEFAVFQDACPSVNSSVWTLKSIDVILYFLKSCSLAKRSELMEYFGICSEKLCSALEDNLMSGFKMVRMLTMSILLQRNGLNPKLSLLPHVLEKFLRFAIDNELKEVNVVTTEHLENYLGMEACLRNMQSTNVADLAALKCALKYVVGSLFQNHAKILKISQDTLVPLLIEKLPGETIWDIVESHFLIMHQGEIMAEITFLGDKQGGSISDFEFWKTLAVKAFGITTFDFDSLGQEVKIDYNRHKNNLWKIIVRLGASLPQRCIDHLIVCAQQVYRQLCPDPPYIFLKDDSVAKEKGIVFGTVLEYLNLLSTKKGPVQNFRREIALGALVGSNKEIKKTAISILRKISPTINTFIAKHEKLGENWLQSVHLKSFHGDDAFFVPEDIAIFMEFVVRSLLGLKCEIKGDYMNRIVRFLHGFKEDEVLQQIQFLFGKLKIMDFKPDVKFLKYLKGQLQAIEKMVNEWRYAFPNVITYLMELVCHFVDITSTAELEANVTMEAEKQLLRLRQKAILSASRSIVVNFFELFEKLPINESLINNIFGSVLRISDTDISNHSSESISWYFNLMMTWSKTPRFFKLFIKCTNQDRQNTVINSLFEVFGSKFLKQTPRIFLMEIITNLAIVQDPEDITDCPPVLCGEILRLPESESPLGERILMCFKEQLLQIITNSQFLQAKIFTGGKAETCLQFLRLCAKFSTESEINHKLCMMLCKFIIKFRNRATELTLAYEFCRELMQNSSPSNVVATELSKCFTWTKEKGPRESLCNTIRVSMTNENHAILISNMNAYAAKVTETLDYEKVQGAFLKSTELIRDSPSFKPVFCTIAANVCFYYLNNDSDIGILAAAEGLLVTISEFIQSRTNKNNNREPVHEFLDGVILPRLKWGVKNKADEVFHLNLKVISHFSKNCGEFHGSLKGIHAIFQQEDCDYLMDLQDMQVSTRANAIKQLQKTWPIMRTYPATVTDFVIPIVSHHLLDKTKLRVSFQHLIQCCLEAIKWCVFALPHGAFFKYLDFILEAVPEEEILIKQYHKLLGFVLDGFHYELDEEYVTQLSSTTNKYVKPEEKNMGTADIQNTDGEHLLTVKLNYEESRSLMNTVEEKFIPKLRQLLNLEEKTRHKLAKVVGDSDAMVKKIPTTLAYVKLLKKLPAAFMASHTIWVIPTLCCSLNNRLISIRTNVRNTLIRIVEELGPCIFPEIVKSCKSYLVRGYQKHVRNYTLLLILKQLSNLFVQNPACVPIPALVSIVEDELFGYMSEDKQVGEILKNTPEAKSQNGLQLLFCCSKFTGLDSLAICLKSPMERAKSAKNLDTLKIVKSWVLEVSNGLTENQNISPEDLLRFLLSQFETYCAAKPAHQVPNSKNEKYLVVQPDIFIVPASKKQAPTQGTSAVVAACSWFVYSCLYNILKRVNVTDNEETLLCLDQFARGIINSENDEELEVRVHSLRSLVLMYQFPLQCFLEKHMVNKMWRKYFLAVNGEVSNENVNMYYKFLTSFCITFTEFRLESNDFNLLIQCITRHLQENKCTGSALVLVRNILQRSLVSTGLKTLIKEIKRRIYMSDAMHVQEGCRAAYLVYVKNYLKTKEEYATELYDFFKVLGYRKTAQDAHSVLRMIAALLAAVPQSWFKDLGVTIAMDLMLALMKTSDEDSQKIICNLCMKNLYEQMSAQDGLEFVKELQSISKDSKMIPYYREIGLTIGKIVEFARCWDSEEVVQELLDVLVTMLTPAPLIDLQSQCAHLQQIHRDFGVYEAILASQRVSLMCIGNNASSEKIISAVRKLAEWARNEYLSYNHESVQDAAIQFVNSHMHSILSLGDMQNKIPKILDTISQLKNKEALVLLVKAYVKLGNNEAEECRKNVTAGLNHLALLACQHDDKLFHLELTKDIRHSVNMEIRKTPQKYNHREVAFSFWSTYTVHVPDDCLDIVQQNLMNVTTRELTDKNINIEHLHSLCTTIQKKIEERVGRQTFLHLYENARAPLQKKREESRAKKKEQAVVSMDTLSGVAFRKRKRKGKKPQASKKRKVK